MKRPLRKIIDYLVLAFIISASIVLILLYNGNQTRQIAIVVGMTLLYVLWGVLHHLREKTFYLGVLLEYALYGLLGCALIIGLLV